MKQLEFSNHASWDHFVEMVRSVLATDGVARISHFAPDDNNTLLVKLANSLGSVTVEGVNVPGNVLENGFVHRIEERAEPLRDKFGFPIISTTAQRFLCHTDHYFAKTPADVVIFQCVRDDPLGGDSLVAQLAKILDILPEKHRLTLQECRFPAPFGAVAILYLVGGSMRIRYNRLEVDRAASVANVALTPAQCAALDSLDDAIEATQLRFHLQQAECLVMDNHRVLHGRTPLSPHSDRLLKRVRLSL